MSKGLRCALTLCRITRLCWLQGNFSSNMSERFYVNSIREPLKVTKHPSYSHWSEMLTTENGINRTGTNLKISPATRIPNLESWGWILGWNRDRFPPCYSQSPPLADFTPPPPPMNKSDLKLVCNVNIVFGNLKSQNPQDYAQKHQRNCTFMNLSPVHICPPNEPLAWFSLLELFPSTRTKVIFLFCCLAAWLLALNMQGLMNVW